MSSFVLIVALAGASFLLLLGGLLSLTPKPVRVAVRNSRNR